ncbi:class I tRNA ligase family protein, partial [[Eubacterium] cellulosolvens]
FGIPAEVVKEIKPISLIKTSKSDFEDPAGDICKEMGIKNQLDHDKLEEATKTIYKLEYHSGVMTSICGEYSGLRVDEVKDTLFKDFIELGVADIFYEFSEKVVCRCGTNVIIKLIPDQWFIRYSDPELTARSQEQAKKMTIIPHEYYQELPGVLDWFSDRACIRQGSWLGTEFPFKKDWIIEPISDSTLYPSYYIISKYINDGTITPEQLTEQFFNYVFLGDGEPDKLPDIDPEIAKKIKADYDYWYPVDINLGGKEHKTVHFPVFLMNHVAILGDDKWPQGIFVNWWVTQAAGDKISKSQVSKGGAEPIPDAAEKYTVDGMRLYYSHVGSANLDIEWDQNTVLNYKSRLNRLWDLFQEILGIVRSQSAQTPALAPGAGKAELDVIDQWLLNTLNNRVQTITELLEKYDIRAASNEIYFGIYSDMRWYLRRGGGDSSTLKSLAQVWIKLLSPFTPFIAEELWELFGFNTGDTSETFVSVAEFPKYDPEINFKSAEASELYLRNVVEDINEILKVIKIKPKKVIIYTCPAWKYKMQALAKRLLNENKLEMSVLMQESMSDPAIKQQGKAAPGFAQKLITELKRAGAAEAAAKAPAVLEKLNEHEYLTNAKNFFENNFGCEVQVFSGDDSSSPDPGNKMKAALPLRPAIYIE